MMRWCSLACFVCLLACGGTDDDAPAASTETEVEDPRAAGTAGETAPAATDDMSLFLLELALEDQDGHPFTLASQRGHPIVVTFFYASCDTMCPLILSEVRALEAALDESTRANLRVVVVSIDPEHDSAARLREVAAERSLPMDRWSLVRGSESEVRTLASTLGMNYRATPDGFAHGALLTVLDGDGVVVAQSVGTGQPLEPLVARIASLTAASAR